DLIPADKFIKSLAAGPDGTLRTLQPFRKRPPHIHKTLSYRVQFYTFFRIFSTIRAHPLLVPPVKSPDSHSDDIILQPVCFFFGYICETTAELQSRFDLVCRLLLAQ